MNKIKSWIEEHKTELEVAGMVVSGLVLGLGIGFLIGNHNSYQSLVETTNAGEAYLSGVTRMNEAYEKALGGRLLSVSKINRDTVTIESLGDQATVPENSWLIELLNKGDKVYEYRDIIVEVPSQE